MEILPQTSPFRDPVEPDDDLASTADILARFVGNSRYLKLIKGVDFKFH